MLTNIGEFLVAIGFVIFAFFTIMRCDEFERRLDALEAQHPPRAGEGE